MEIILVLKNNHLTRPIVSIGISQIINWGVLYYSLALIGPKIIAEMHWSDVFVYSGFSISAIVSGLLSPFSGKAIDRIGGRYVMALGSFIGSVGIFFLSAVSSMLEYALAWTIIGISMSMCLYDSAFASVARIAGKATRKAISSITLLAGFSSTLTWPATAFLLSINDWRSVLFFYSFLMIFTCVPVLYFGLKDDCITQFNSDLTNSKSSIKNFDAPELCFPHGIIIKLMALLAFITAAQGFIANAISVHIITFFQEIGLGSYGAILAGSLIGPAQVGARLIELLFGKQLSPIKLGLITVAVLPISFLVPLVFPTFTITGIIFGLTYGASNGVFTIVRSLIPYSLFGSLGYGKRLGTLATPTLFVKAIAPALFGYLLNSTGPHFSLFILFSISILVSFAMLKLAKIVKDFSPAPAI